MTQFTPPQVHPINPNPKLVADASLLGPRIEGGANPNLPTLATRWANGTSDSLGHGNGTVLEAEPAEDLGGRKRRYAAAERFARSERRGVRVLLPARIHRTQKRREKAKYQALWSSKQLSKRTTA